MSGERFAELSPPVSHLLSRDFDIVHWFESCQEKEEEERGKKEEKGRKKNKKEHIIIVIRVKVFREIPVNDK